MADKKLHELTISVFDKKTKNKRFTLDYNVNYTKSLSNYIIECFKFPADTSVVLYKQTDPPRNQQILDDNIFFKDLNVGKFIFYLFVFPNSTHKSLFLDFINEQKDPEVYFYAVLQGKGVKEKALDITQPNKGNSKFDLNKHVETAKDHHNILFAYKQFLADNPTNPLSPRQYLVYNNLRKDLYENENVKQFLDNYDSPFKYQRKVYEYYKFQLSPNEVSIVNGLLTKYFKINLDTDDGDEDDAENEIIKKKELVLNIYMASNKNEELTKTAIEVSLDDDI